MATSPGHRQLRTSRRGTFYVYVCMKCSFFCTLASFSLPPAGLLSRSRLWGTREARVYNTAQVWAQAGLRGACSGRSSRARRLFTESLCAEPEPSKTMETHTKNDPGGRFSHVPLCITADASPGRLATSHLEHGRLATSQPPRTSALLACTSSHASSSIRRAAVLLLLCSRMTNRNISPNSGANIGC